MWTIFFVSAFAFAEMEFFASDTEKMEVANMLEAMSQNACLQEQCDLMSDPQGRVFIVNRPLAGASRAQESGEKHGADNADRLIGQLAYQKSVDETQLAVQVVKKTLQDNAPSDVATVLEKPKKRADQMSRVRVGASPAPPSQSKTTKVKVATQDAGASEPAEDTPAVPVVVQHPVSGGNHCTPWGYVGDEKAYLDDMECV